MKKLEALLLNCLIFAVTTAQPTIQWQKTYGGSYYDETRDLCVTVDGGFAFLGNTRSNDGDITGFLGVRDFWVAKCNAIGELKWQKAIGGNSHDWPLDMQMTSDDGLIVVGYTESDNVNAYHGDKDGLVVKLNSNGDIEWQKALGGSDWDEIWSVTQTSDGGYALVGHSGSIDGDASGNAPVLLDLWVVRLNASGEILWQRTFGGSNTDWGRSIISASEGGFFVLGTTFSDDGNVTNQHGDSDLWLLKIDDSGNLEWQKTYGGCCADYGRSVYETNDAIFICGQAGSSDGDVTDFKGFGDMWVIKTTKTGEILWAKTLGGSNADNALSGSPLPDGGFIVGGHTKSMDGDITEFKGIQDIWVARLKADGSILWQKSIGGTDGESCYAINQTSDGGFILGGNTWSTDGDVTGSIIRGQNDFWVVKLGPETVSTSSAALPELAVSPNPVSDMLSFTIPETVVWEEIRIYNLAGQAVLQNQWPGRSAIPVAGMPAGMYLLQATATDGHLYFGKFLKE